jgi:PadR family transcriptional regulator AphA
MDYRRVEKDGKAYIELLPGGRIASEQDAVDVVGACGEEGVVGVLLREENLSDDFFDLKTGLAGAVLLKWSTYAVKAAAVVSPGKIGNGKFYEFVLETNRGRQFFVANDRKAAEEWLIHVS